MRDKEAKQETKIRRTGRRLSFVRNKEIMGKLHKQSQEGIAKLIKELRVEPKSDDPKLEVVEKMVGDPKLFLTYNGHLQPPRY